jgi:hypothetical protein
VKADGSINLVIEPVLGFRIELTALDRQLVNTRVEATFHTGATLLVSAINDGLCQGVYYGLQSDLGVAIDIENPIPGWSFGDRHRQVFPTQSVTLRPMTCYPWSATSSKRGLESEIFAEPSELQSRAVLETLFPDGFGALLGCPTDFESPTGNCAARIFPEPGDSLKRSVGPEDLSIEPPPPPSTPQADADRPTSESSTELFSVEDVEDDIPSPEWLARRALEKRLSTKSSYWFCTPPTQIFVPGISYPTGRELRNQGANPTVYAPNPAGGCDDYSIITIPLPDEGQIRFYHAEHILEWRLLQDFWRDSEDLNVGVNLQRDNPVSPNFGAAPSQPIWRYCEYLWFWWTQTRFTYPIQGTPAEGTAVALLTYAIPNKDFFYDELVLLDDEVNGIKEAYVPTVS